MNIIKRFFICIITLIPVLSISAQTLVYNSVNPDSINSLFIDSFYNEQWKNVEPYVLKKNMTLFSNNQKEQYNISLLKFKNWDNEPGDFNVIKISSRVQTDFIQTDADGWNYFYTEGTTSDISKPVYTTESSDGCTFVLFTGIEISSEPPFLTIYTLKNGKVTLVFNKRGYINNISTIRGKSDFTFQLNTLEYRNLGDTIPIKPADIHHIIFTDGKITYQ